MITITTGAGYHEVHPHTVTNEYALDTYRMTIKNERVEDYPNWVRDVATALNNDGSPDGLEKYGQWVMEVYNELKKQ